jgi:hypothetical protein
MDNKKLNKIIKESIDKVLLEMPTTVNAYGQGPLSKRLQKVMSAVAEIASLVNSGSKCIPFDSTWQNPYTVCYTAKIYRGNAIKVTRVEQPGKWYTNNGREIQEPPIKDEWIITDRNFQNKWIGEYQDGLKYQISYDKKAYNKYNR